MRTRKWSWGSVAVVVGLLAATTGPAVAAEGDPVCVDDGPYSSGVVARVCLSTPASGQAVSGLVEVTATLQNVGTQTSPLSAFGARRMIFTLDGQDLLIDYSAPYTFQLPTDTFVDGNHVLEVRALLRDSFTDEIDHETPLISVPLSFENGVTQPPTTPNRFSPTSGRPAGPGQAFVVAATGDGASGEPDANAVSDLIDSWNPNMMLYLGDVYEDGTYTEFFNWYGVDTLWGRFADVTNPTVGNHEYSGGVTPGYSYYWGNPPHYYSVDAHGWHFATVDSNTVYGGTDPGTAQFEWLRQDLLSSTARCTVVFLHHPVWSIGSQGSTPRLQAMWDVMVEAGVDIVLTGHDHNYQRWVPMDADGMPDPNGPTHFVAGMGGHGIRPFATSDARVAAGADTFRDPDASGSLRFVLGESSASFEYKTIENLTLDSGEIECSEPQPSTIRDSVLFEQSALAGMLPTGNGSLDDKVEKAVEHLDKATADNLWDTDDRPANEDGEKVLDELKKAVKELEDAPANAAVSDSILALTTIGHELTTNALSEAEAAYGELGELGKAREELAEGLVKWDEGKFEETLNKFKSSFEHARKALGEAPDPWTPGVGHRGAIGDVLAALWTSVPTGDGGDDGHIESAVKELTKALDTQLWDDENRPGDDSDAKVPDGIKKAVEDLEGVKETDVTPAMLELIEVSSGLAHDALDEAIARGGDPNDIADAEKEIGEAEKKLAEGKYKDAADKYKKAFEKARGA